MERRRNRLTAAYVDAILDFCTCDERESAVIVLLEHGLPLQTALRIVGGDASRRACADTGGV